VGRHVALIRLHEEDILSLLDMPDDVSLRAVFANPRTMCLELVVEGARFEEVDPGVEPPDLQKEVDYQLVKILTDEESVYLRRWKVVMP
jgi:hypothetical protein